MPFNYVKHLRATLFDALDLYEVLSNKCASAIALGVQKAIDAGKANPPTDDRRRHRHCMRLASRQYDPVRFG